MNSYYYQLLILFYFVVLIVGYHYDNDDDVYKVLFKISFFTSLLGGTMIETHLDLIMCFDRGQTFFQRLWKPNGKLLKLLDFSFLSVDKKFQEKN